MPIDSFEKVVEELVAMKDRLFDEISVYDHGYTAVGEKGAGLADLLHRAEILLRDRVHS